MRNSLILICLLLTGLSAAADWAPDIESWLSETPPQPTAVIIRSATVWTGSEDGILESADLLIRNGRIAAVGSSLRAPRGALEIDGEGRHVTPGIIDAHSHAAIIGGVNESSHISTAQVRIADVIDADSINIYRQLAGGVTTIFLLHGSANAIGGQSATIKMRWGAEPRDLLLEGAPEGIKFALGENPKQSNWQPDEPRYPQTRHGVAQIIQERFQQARDYQRRIDEMPSGRDGRDRVPPRPDYELAAIAEILSGERDVHAHSYRADEILMLIRLAERFGFVVKTFQHVLEGYKVAPEIAEHGTGGSTFIDWWAFKYEAKDGIGYNPALMHRAGVVTGLHSDNPELARRMNLEAAKAVRYGDVDPHTALKMITAWPADQLGVGDRVGRLREGFDADLVIWNGHPLSVYSRVEQTWVDGRRYFDRETDLARRQALAEERQALIARVLEANGNSNDNRETQAEQPEQGRTFRSMAHAHLLGYRPWELEHDEYCLFDDHNH